MTKQEQVNLSVQSNREEKIDFLNNIKKSNDCCKCSEKRFYLLDFHHVNPCNKEFALSKAIQKNYSYTRIIAEVNKCILLCSNCHREFHYLFGLDANETSLKKYLKSDKIIFLKQEKIEEKKFVRTKSCCDCGEPISITATRCNQCASKLRITNKPINRDELKLLIRSLPMAQIGKRFGVSDNSIRKWCSSYGLPTSKRIINKYSDEEWEKI